MVELILAECKLQGCTCMYTKDELETFSEEKLKNIHKGLMALRKISDMSMSNSPERMRNILQDA